MKLNGLVPAVFTPMKENGALNLNKVDAVIKHLLSDNISGIFVCGSTGEGASLALEERMATALAYVSAVNKKIPVVVHVGHNSLKEAQKLSAHAQQIGADAIAAIPPSYFKINSLETVVDCMVEVASAAPELPFYFYNIPGLTGVSFDMVEFLQLAKERIPNLVGIKFSAQAIAELQAIQEFDDGRYNILFGSDEMLLSALSVGVTGAVGSNYNYAAPLYLNIINAFQQNNLDEARHYQSLSIRKVRVLFKYRGLPAIKAMMKLIGVDCGPMRLPFQSLTSAELKQLEKEMKEIGFFDWGRK